MRSLYHHANATWFENVSQRLCNLDRQPFLHLQSSRENIYYPSKFGESYDLAVRYVCDVCLSKEWQQVMFAHRVQFDIADQNHVGLVLREHCVTDHRAGILRVPLSQEGHRTCNASRGLEQPFTLRTFSDQLQLTSYRRLIRRQCRCRYVHRNCIVELTLGCEISDHRT